MDGGGTLREPVRGAPAAPRDDLEKVVINNRLRRTLEGALVVLSLSAPGREERLDAVRALQRAPDPDVLPAVEAALTKEKDKEVREALVTTEAMLALSAPQAARRTAAAQQLRRVPGGTSKRPLAPRLAGGARPAGEGGPEGGGESG